MTAPQYGKNAVKFVQGITCRCIAQAWSCKFEIKTKRARNSLKSEKAKKNETAFKHRFGEVQPHPFIDGTMSF